MFHTLYLMRHGENTANVGWPVIPDKQVVLSERGHEQAQCLAERLNHVYTTAVYISELQRNQQTAAPLCELWELLPQVLPCLNELCHLGCPHCQRESGRTVAHGASLLNTGRCTPPRWAYCRQLCHVCSAGG